MVMEDATDKPEDSDTGCLLTPSTRVGSSCHRLCHKRVVGYPRVNLLMLYMKGLPAVDMVEALELSADDVDEEEHDWSRR